MSKKMLPEKSLEVFGDFACFTPPWAKVGQLTYPVPTPSAARGILSAIYSTPASSCSQRSRKKMRRKER